MLSGQDIVCISSIDWDFIWQGHQEIMSTLARQGNRVLFIENTGVRSPRLKDLPRLRQRLRNWWRGTKGFREVRERLVIYSPLILPLPYSRVARWINRWLLVRALRRWMRAAGFARPIVWTFLPTPLARDVTQALDPQLVVYYCIDDFSASSREARKTVESEAQLFREADLVFVTSERLRQRAARYRPMVHVFPFGVNFEQFERVRESAGGPPEELRALPRPIIGYIGGIHQWVDQALVADASRLMPEASFVLVGPAQSDVSQLTGRPNVHLLGARPHPDVPRYIKGFDVGIVPYRQSDYTANVYPTKLNEYLAMGIPVVATDLPEIRRFNERHGPVVGVAGDAQAFADAVRACALGAGMRDRRIAVAQSNSWTTRIEAMSGLVLEALAQRRIRPVRWEAALLSVYQVARRRIAAPLIIGAALAGLMLYTPLIWWAAQPLRTAEAPAPADAIVVFAGGAGESGQPGQGYEERVAWAVELYRRGLAPKLVFSSGMVYAFREPDVMKALALSLGVPEADILLETRSASTRDNVEFVDRLLDERGWQSLLLVSSPYHMRRAALTWKRLAPEKRVRCIPAPESLFYRHGRDDQGRAQWKQATWAQVRAILHEYAGLLYYRWRGWI